MSRHQPLQTRFQCEKLYLFGVIALIHVSPSSAWAPPSKALSQGLPGLAQRQRPLQQRPNYKQRIIQLWDKEDENEERSHSRRPALHRRFSSMVSRVRGKRLSPPVRPNGQDTTNVELLKLENELLRKTIRQLELENDMLQRAPGKIVIESFEGERKLRSVDDAAWFDQLPDQDTVGITMQGEEMETDLWCDDLEDGQCPVEPTISFGEALRDRAYWLVGLLALQSCSGFILSRNEILLEKHPVIIYFLTMLVGAGGNAGNQASVRVIRGLALGTLNENTQGQFLARELKMAGSLCAVLSCAGFVRAFAFRTPYPETLAITSALALIVFSSVCLGAILPLILKKLGVDPAHSSTTIQVVMDILGVLLTVLVSSVVLDSPFGQLLVAKLSVSP